MSNEKMTVTQKTIDDTLIASIRFRGKYEQAGLHFDELYQQCEKHVCGPAFCLYHYETGTEGGVDIEVCFPVAQAVEANDVKSRTLPGGEVLSALHHGSYDKLTETYKRLFDYIKGQGISVQETEREIYLVGGGGEDEDKAKTYVTEIQVFLQTS